MYTDGQLDNISCSCLLACALADYAKKRARLQRASAALRFLSGGQDRFLLDELHRLHMADLQRYAERRIVRASLAILRARYRALHGAAGAGFWDKLEKLFLREYACGRINLFEIDWE